MAPDSAVDAHLASVHQRERALSDFTTTGLQTAEAIWSWMERTSWPQVHEGVRLDLLRSLTKLPYSTACSVDLLFALEDRAISSVSPLTRGVSLPADTRHGLRA
ncbi:hypothetical protein ASPBRDRAFT_198198 [Aspergillus brasiliensis CBS 101740]|uniref:Uncharacterized protein n=1 Tax=Aspergillus brasiliensis (strain CBS 101740 / IMI 381727 / IBT 21946) TaxID=767769 RepID=A0A1L9UDA3_ASPBC|nr:hypothetical protein ASPBRDRAFT_198198 [Aspergillus brasiliensis CBS 101740]